ncbi:MAG: M23 family metallopeptidase [Clostridia bacterium]|nr:M23 family metallopeptidase [Clostridia bacterium]
MKRAFLLILLLTAVALLIGCNAAEPVAAVPTEAPTPTATASPSPPPIELDIQAASATPTNTPAPTPTPNWIEPAEQAFLEALDPDFSEYEASLKEVDLTLYATVVENTSVFKALTEDINSSIAAALQAAANSASELVLEPDLKYEPLYWQQVAGLVRGFGGEAKEMLKAHISFSADDSGEMRAIIADYDTIIGFEPENQALTAKFTLAYLNTVYDDDGVEKDFEPYPVPEEYLLTVANPLPNHHMKDGWYQNRSKATRKHVGMDITGRYKTEILSVTDGIVVYKGGEHPTCGYYVVIEDEYGYEYHYYHFAEMTTLNIGDEVKQGDVVGLMGKTGNSDGVHLHIAIIAPDYSYLNPYTFFQAAGLTD